MLRVVRLGLPSGTRFVVLGDQDVVILRAIAAPSMDEFDDLVAAARAAALRTNLKRADVRAAVTEVRRRAATRCDA